MKKGWMTILGVCMMGAVLLTGCGSENAEGSADGVWQGSNENEGSNDKKESEGSDVTGYVFTYNGTTLAVDMDMSTVEDELGEPDSYFEQPSCAAEGIAKIYTYSSFEINTYPDGNQDLIACIILKDDNVATAEGIDLSMTKEDIIDAYGSGYEETERSIVYEKDGMKLCFILDGDDIISIEYDSPVLN